MPISDIVGVPTALLWRNQGRSAGGLTTPNGNCDAMFSREVLDIVTATSCVPLTQLLVSSPAPVWRGGRLPITSLVLHVGVAGTGQKHRQLRRL